MGQIHSAIKFLYQKTLRLDRPYLDIYRAPKKMQEKIILSQKQVPFILNSIDDFRYKTACELMYSCGLRVSEATALTVKQINRSQGLLSIYGKGKKYRSVPISCIMFDKLSKLWLPHRHPQLIFPDYAVKDGYNRGVADIPISNSTLNATLKKAAKRCQFSRTVTCHTLRHCYGTHMLEEGADRRSVQDNLGHRSARTTSTYVHHTSKLSRRSSDAVDKIAKNLSE